MAKRQTDPNRVYQAAMAQFEKRQFAPARKLLLELHASYPRECNILRLLGACCGELGRLDEAVRHLTRVVQLEPSGLDYFNLGKAHQLADHYLYALAAHEAGLQLAPLEARLLQGRASVLLQLGRLDEAIAGLKDVLKRDPNFLEASANLGNALMQAGRDADAIPYLERASTLDPANTDLRASIVFAGLAAGHWAQFETGASAVIKAVNTDSKVDPFVLLTIADDPQLHARAAINLAKSKPVGLSQTSLPPLASAHRDGKIRVAYLSADFRSHATSYLVAGLFEAHDRSRFEIIAISTGRNDDHPIRKRIEAGVDHFIDASTLNRTQLVTKVRELNTHIALDMMGHTRNASDLAFQARLAPVQVSYLGYPGTTAIETMDYIVVDPFIAQPTVRRHLTEKPVVLPHCYQPNDRARPRPEVSKSRAEYGLPDQGVVFCAFNTTRKILPDTFASWMRILASVDDSVLWLHVSDETARANLCNAATHNGIDAARLVFAAHREHAEHLARYLTADIFLDTFPYGAHTTGSDALWMGCPVVTRVGESFPARVCGSLLTTVGLPELMTTTADQFEALAIDLARDPIRVAALRRHLDDHRLLTPLFDTALYTRHLEAALAEMYQRLQAGKKPQPITVAALPDGTL